MYRQMAIRKGGYIMTYTELKEIISTWDENQLRATHTLLNEGEALEDIIDLIEEYQFTFHENLEDYILSTLENTGSELPTWVCVDVVGTYCYSLRYEDNIIFVDSLPRWAEGGSQYGTEEEKRKYREGLEYLCKYSEVLEVYR